jgi:hypothetical protein
LTANSRVPVAARHRLGAPEGEASRFAFALPNSVCGTAWADEYRLLSADGQVTIRMLDADRAAVQAALRVRADQ